MAQAPARTAAAEPQPKPRPRLTRRQRRDAALEAVDAKLRDIKILLEADIGQGQELADDAETRGKVLQVDVSKILKHVEETAQLRRRVAELEAENAALRALSRAAPAVPEAAKAAVRTRVAKGEPRPPSPVQGASTEKAAPAPAGKDADAT